MQVQFHLCRFCEYKINISYPNIIHSGFNENGFMYCDSCPNLLTWSIFDFNYEQLINNKVPWLLNDDEKNIIERSVIKCECGGNFKFSAQPRCPNCNNEIPEILPDKIHYIKLGKVINSSSVNIWNIPIKTK